MVSFLVEDFPENANPKLDDWIAQNYEQFVGDYVHPLFGNFSIEYNETRQRLMFTQGRIVEGSLISINVEEPTEQKQFFIAFEGTLFRCVQGQWQPILAITFKAPEGC